MIWWFMRITCFTTTTLKLHTGSISIQLVTFSPNSYNYLYLLKSLKPPMNTLFFIDLFYTMAHYRPLISHSLSWVRIVFTLNRYDNVLFMIRDISRAELSSAYTVLHASPLNLYVWVCARCWAPLVRETSACFTLCRNLRLLPSSTKRKMV